jgi:hypothetical protein
VIDNRGSFPWELINQREDPETSLVVQEFADEMRFVGFVSIQT